MFLFKLNDEEKLVFLELAHYVARSDGSFSEKEEFITQLSHIDSNKFMN